MSQVNYFSSSTFHLPPRLVPACFSVPALPGLARPMEEQMRVYSPALHPVLQPSVRGQGAFTISIVSYQAGACSGWPFSFRGGTESLQCPLCSLISPAYLQHGSEPKLRHCESAGFLASGLQRMACSQRGLEPHSSDRTGLPGSAPGSGLLQPPSSCHPSSSCPCTCRHTSVCPWSSHLGMTPSFPQTVGYLASSEHHSHVGLMPQWTSA